MWSRIVCLVTGEGLWGLQSGMAIPSVFLTVLLARYGAGSTMIGSIAAVESGGVMLTQVLGLYLFASPRTRKRRLVSWHVRVVAPFLFAMGVAAWFGPSLSPRLARSLLFTFFVLYWSSIGVAVAVWSDWMAHLFPVSIRGRVLGGTLFVYSIAASLGGVLSGALLRVTPDPRVYGVLLLAAAAIAAVSMLAYNAIRDPAEESPDDGIPPDRDRLFSRFRCSLADVNFRSFLGGRALSMVGFAVLPFIAVHYGRPEGGGLGEGTLVACGAAMTAGLAAGNLILGWLGDRWGHKLGIVLGAAMQIACLAMILTGTGVVACSAAYFLAGVGGAAAWVSHMNVLFETCPHDYRAAHITVGNLILGSVGLAAPILAGVFAGRWGLRNLFLLSLGVSVVAVAWLMVKMREPRSGGGTPAAGHG